MNMLPSSSAVVVLPLSIALIQLAVVETPQQQDLILPIVALLYALGALAVHLGHETAFVAVGYVLWVVSYLHQMRCMVMLNHTSAWPIAAAGYYLQNEFVVSFTKWFETPPTSTAQAAGVIQYKTPRFVRQGYRVFFALDMVLTACTVYFGTGSPRDEFGVLSTDTAWERAAAVVAWFAFSFFLTRLTLLIGDCRQAKYWCYAIHFVAHCLILRLPASSTSHGLFNIKLQIFANACFAARFASPTLPSPKYLYRALMFVMPVFSAITTPGLHHHHQGLDFVQLLDLHELRLGSAAWLGGVWVVAVAATQLTAQTAAAVAVSSTKKSVAAAVHPYPAPRGELKTRTI